MTKAKTYRELNTIYTTRQLFLYFLRNIIGTFVWVCTRLVHTGIRNGKGNIESKQKKERKKKKKKKPVYKRIHNYLQINNE